MNSVVIFSVSQINVITENLIKFKVLGFQTIKNNLNAGSDFLKCLIKKLVQHLFS